jgi:hypothetical protein
MKRVDDTKAKQAMLDAIANYTGPITRGLEPRAETRTKRTCKLSEFGECQNEFIPADKKKWTKFCCTQHRKRWHYLNRNEDAEVRCVNGEANGVAKPKLSLAALGLAQPTTHPIKRRKLNTHDAGESA